ncbi:MAG TPA: hypothetical protein VFE65_28435 [Pseudonocardia sp.]|nr:hypothetical protein [Pseudonocardia sp.]
MPQLSFYSAEAHDVCLGDLAGLLCGPGQLARFGASGTARLSVVLTEPERAPALRAEAAVRGIDTETVITDSGTPVVRTAFRRDLVDLACAWTKGAVKAVPEEFALNGALLRMWALAGGIADRRSGYLLRLDPHAPETHVPLATAITRLGLPALRLGPRGGGPALRLSGIRVRRRLAELVGPPPEHAVEDYWPA